MAQPSLGSIQSDINAIRDALVRMGAIPKPPERKPRSGTVYVHLYTDTNDVVRTYTTPTPQLSFDLDGHLATVAVSWREGEGLQERQ